MNIRFGSMANLLVTAVCGGLILVLLLNTVIRKRTHARAHACADQLKSIGLAIHNYHAAYKQLPMATGGTTGNDNPELCNAGYLGSLVPLLPFAEQQPLWETISNPYRNDAARKTFPPMGPVPWFDSEVYEPWGKSPSIFLCPDNVPQPAAAEPRIVRTLKSDAGSQGVLSSYVACFGDGTSLQGKRFEENDALGARHSRAASRGVFVTGRMLKFRDILDGLSNTVCYSETFASAKRLAGKSEIVKDVAGLSQNPSLCLSAVKKPDAAFWEFGRGSRWCDGRPTISGFQTVLPPNSASCTSDRGIDDPVVSAGSAHAGGVFVLMADGAVVFITDSIDCGDPTSSGVSFEPGYKPPGSKSPYGLWGAIGTRASRETIEEHLSAVPPAAGARTLFQDRTPPTSVWRDREGKISLRAEFVEIIDEELIRLRDSSGVIHEVPLNTLDPKDIYRAVEIDVMKKQK